jgi:hypothetical protein
MLKVYVKKEHDPVRKENYWHLIVEPSKNHKAGSLLPRFYKCSDSHDAMEILNNLSKTNKVRVVFNELWKG